MTITNYTETSACSAALNLLGETGINSIENPKTDIEATCATLFPLVLATLLSKHEWSFANPTRQLAVDSDASDDVKAGFKNAFRLPSNLMAGPTGVYNDAQRRYPIFNYHLSGGYLLTDENIIFIRYRAKPAISIMPVYFIDLLITVLAMRMAKSVTDNTSLTTELRIQAFGSADMDGEGGMYAAAKRLDSTAKPMRSLFDNGDPLTATRY